MLGKETEVDSSTAPARITKQTRKCAEARKIAKFTRSKAGQMKEKRNHFARLATGSLKLGVVEVESDPNKKLKVSYWSLVTTTDSLQTLSRLPPTHSIVTSFATQRSIYDDTPHLICNTIDTPLMSRHQETPISSSRLMLLPYLTS